MFGGVGGCQDDPGEDVADLGDIAPDGGLGDGWGVKSFPILACGLTHGNAVCHQTRTAVVPFGCHDIGMEFQLAFSAPLDSHPFAVYVEPEGIVYDFAETGRIVLAFRGPDAMTAEVMHRPDTLIVWRPAETEVWANDARRQLRANRRMAGHPRPRFRLGRSAYGYSRTRTDRVPLPSPPEPSAGGALSGSGVPPRTKGPLRRIRPPLAKWHKRSDVWHFAQR